MARRQFLQTGSGAAVSAAVAAASGLTISDAGAQDDRRPPAGPSPQSLLVTEARVAHLDTREFSRALYRASKPAMSFASKDRPRARAWQKRARGKLVELLGGFPGRARLKPRVLDTRALGGYTREAIVFDSRPDLTVFGYLLLPRKAPTAVPVVICLPGHGRGCDDIVGIAEDGADRITRSGYARDFALQVVENGYAAFAIEQLGFGCRRDEAARRRGAGQSSCQPSAGAALLFGQTMIGWRVWDVMRAIDYLETRPEIDRSRIATMGISGGGTISLFSAALDARIKAAVVSCYFNTFRDSILSLSHCIDNYVPGILNYFEMYDVAGLVAPRGLFIESGSRDPIFPVEGSREAFQKARAIYSAFRAGDKLGFEVFEGEHVFHGKGAFEFLRSSL
jgi:dienelactone hydrolase